MTGSEDEANELLERHLERSLPGSDALVLRRNNSDNRLEATGLEASDDGLVHGARRRRAALVHGDPLRTRPSPERERPAARLVRAVRRGRRRRGDVRAVARRRPGHRLGARPPRRSARRGRRRAHPRLGLAGRPGPRQPAQPRQGRAPGRDRRAHRAWRTPAPSRTRSSGWSPRRSGRAKPLTAVMVDLDHFKALNDVYGHERGNEALAAVGQILTAGVRASDFAGRYGGEEFIMLLPDTAREGGVVLAEKVRRALAALVLPEVDRPITASFGVATLPDDAARREHARARRRPRALPGQGRRARPRRRRRSDRARHAAVDGERLARHVARRAPSRRTRRPPPSPPACPSGPPAPRFAAFASASSGEPASEYARSVAMLPGQDAC